MRLCQSGNSTALKLDDQKENGGFGTCGALYSTVSDHLPAGCHHGHVSCNRRVCVNTMELLRARGIRAVLGTCQKVTHRTTI
jgi:hypothetical protein